MPAVEHLHNGLVTTRDASLLEPGELTAAINVTLQPGSSAVSKAPGRVLFGTVPGGQNIDGLGYARFDTTNDQLVAISGGTFYTATAGESGAFDELSTDAGLTLDVVSHLNKNVLMTGATGGNRVLLSDGTSRPQGLQPVTGTPGVLLFTSGGAWPLGANQLGWFDYWTTEVYINGDDEVESTFVGTPYSQEITAVTHYTQIFRHSTVNPEATHWRIYRSNRKTLQSDQAFPLGFLIATIKIPSDGTSGSFKDGLATTTALTLPTTVAQKADIHLDDPNVTYSNAAWTGISDAKTDDGVYATSGTAVGIFGSPTSTKVISQFILRDFGFTNIGDGASSIKIEVEGSNTSAATLNAYLSWDGGTSWTKGKAIPFSTSNNTVTVDGGDWGRTWAGTEFSDTTFRVLLIVSAPAIAFGAATGTSTIDYLKVGITHSSATGSLNTLFPNVPLTIAGRYTPIGANGCPPPSTTGDVFQGAIVQNDIDNPSNVVWTIPGTVDYNPVHYRLAIDDTVKCIRSLGSLLCVGGLGTVERLNYLPVAEDPEFNTGRARELVDSDEGMVNGSAAVRFILNGRLNLFYAGFHSLRMTDGYSVTTATDDINWGELVDPRYISQCLVENNTKTYEITIYYPGMGDDALSKVLRLNYHPSHLKNGKLKVVSIDDYAPTAATFGGDSVKHLYTAVGDDVYLENVGYNDASGGDLAPSITTREMHLANIGGSWELPRVGVHHQGGGGSLTLSANGSLANTTGHSTDPQTISLTSRMQSLFGNAIGGDGIQLSLNGEDDGLPWTLDYLVLYPTSETDSITLKS